MPQPFLLLLANSTTEEQFFEALDSLYSRGRTTPFDLYALFCEMGWPEGYSYCRLNSDEMRRLYRDLLRNQERYPWSSTRAWHARRWRSRGYTEKALDRQAELARQILERVAKEGRGSIF